MPVLSFSRYCDYCVVHWFDFIGNPPAAVDLILLLDLYYVRVK